MFSNSTSVKQKELPDLSNINEVVAFFPGLEKLEIPKWRASRGHPLTSRIFRLAWLDREAVPKRL
jgi:hypothetical protein